jgi:hypothetical protein
MPNNIPNVTVSAPVIQLKNDLYLVDGQYAPRTLNIPCGVNAWVDDIQHWCVPIKDFGICTNVFFEPAVGDYPPGTPPTPDSLLVLKVRDKYYPAFTWWVACTKDEYYAACQTCCGEDYVAIPDPILPVIIPCQNVCDAQNADGNYFVTFGAPDLGAGEGYQTFGQFDGEVLPVFESTSLDDLVSDLNTNYGTIGSPSVTIVWTRAGNAIIGTFQDGEGVDSSMCLLITDIPPSP